MKNTLKLFALVAFMFAAFATSAQTAKPIKLGCSKGDDEYARIQEGSG